MPDIERKLTESEFRFLRDEIRHEDGLINQRLSWLVSSQSFLITAFAITLNGPTQMRLTKYEAISQNLIAILPVTGIVICLVCSLAIFGALLQMRHIRLLAGNGHPENLPSVQGTNWSRSLALAGPILVPLIFLFIWVCLLDRS